MPTLCMNTIVAALSDDPGTAPQICDRIGIPFTGRIYGKLSAMEQSGLLRSWWGDPTASRAGFRPRYYALLPAAEEGG